MDRVTFFFGGWEPVARVLVVGTLAYAALVLLLRVSGKRTLARMNAFDFLVTVALGASFGRVLTARSVALVEAFAAFALLVSLQYGMTWIQVRSPRFARAVTSPPTLLYFRGRFLRDAMLRERVTEDELRTAVREHGAGSFDQVEAVVLESDGRFAVIMAKKAGDGSALESIGTEG
ncbi:MAG TPA: YetF domain-containing protein [Longimicrobiaceae bacterium]|nr:YetF domain-containing protein [Longimicrobiaceae bacterium]